MELLKGQTLKNLITGRSLAVPQLVELGIQIADALDALIPTARSIAT